MANAQTALQRMREICLPLPETAEAGHFGEACFRVGKRIFASCGEKAGVCRLVFQLEPDHARRLVASDGRVEPYPRQADCVWVDVDAVEDWDEVRELVLESYRLNAPGNRPARKAPSSARKKKPRK